MKENLNFDVLIVMRNIEIATVTHTTEHINNSSIKDDKYKNAP
jgi:hypothetical protein